MERTREVRRSTMAGSNGLSRRRPRSTSLRDSLEEDGHVEMQDTLRLRDRAEKRERDRDSSNRSKKRRGDKFSQRGGREEGEESTEESVGDEEEYETEDGGGGGGGGPARILPQNVLSFHQNYRKSLPSGRVLRQAAPALKSTDEMIGVPVPRKARSVSVKRVHEYCASWCGSFGEDQNHKPASTSPASRSIEAGSPSSSNVSVRKKMKQNGPKTRLPKPSKSSSSGQEDIEIEIAEVLYGLKKQSQSSKEDAMEISVQKPESKDTNGVSDDAKPSAVSPLATSAKNNGPPSDPLSGFAQKKREVEAEGSPPPVDNSSVASVANLEIEHPSKPEISSPIWEKASGLDAEVAVTEVAPGSMKSQEDVTKQVQSKHLMEESRPCDGSVTKEQSISPKEESASCPKMEVDFQDSAVPKGISAVSDVESQREEKFEIDLMAPPPMPSSPERDGFIDLASDLKTIDQNSEMKREALSKNEEKVWKKEVVLLEETGEKKMETILERCESLKPDLKKPNQDDRKDSSIKVRHQGQKQHQQVQQLEQQQPAKITPKAEKTGQPTSVPSPITLAGWPSGLPPISYMPPFQAIMPMDATTGSSTQAIQPAQFLLSQPRPKRCATHHYIARNIQLHQQFMKMNQFWPPSTGSASFCGSRPSAENMFVGNLLPGSFPVLNVTSAQDKVQAVGNTPGLNRREKTSESANFLDTAQRKQLVLQQAPQQSAAAAGNLLHGQAFLFPLSQHQQPVAATGNQSAPSKSSTSTTNTSLAGNSVAGVSAKSAALPAVAGAVSFNYPSLNANEAPYLTILPNNGYPFPVGTPPAMRGGPPAQAVPFFNGSFYPSQMFHPSQLPPQQTRQNASTSSASSSSHKQLQSQQSRSGNNLLNPSGIQTQHQQKQHVSPCHQSRKLEAEMSGENSPLLVDSRGSHTQKGAYAQSLTVPLQPLNFAMMPSTTVGLSSGNGNHSEKQSQSQQKCLKGGVEMISSQAFAMSFASFSANGAASNINYSSMAQNHAVFQGLPDVPRPGFHIVAAPQAAQQKNHQVSEGKIGGGSTNLEDGKKAILGKPHTTNGQTLVFDNSARSLNFVSTPVTTNWPPRCITSAALTGNAPIATGLANSQQQQMLAHQKQHMLHLQQQPALAGRSKSSATNTLPVSSIAAKFSSNSPVFHQTLVQSNAATGQSAQWKNSARTPVSQVPSSSPAANSSTLKNLSQQQARAPQGQTQISFVGNSKPALAPQGQQIASSSQSPSLVVGSPPSGNLRTSSTGSKSGSGAPALQSQQTENSSGTGQKSSPVCGRNVPSILSSCPSHMSELKY